MKSYVAKSWEVRAFLNGSKTRLTIPIKIPPAGGLRKSVFCKSGVEDLHGREVKYPYSPGDKVFVREVFRDWNAGTTPIQYKADYSKDELKMEEQWGPRPVWCAPGRMPQDHSRITLLIKSGRLKRLLKITDYDACLEGIDWRTWAKKNIFTAKNQGRHVSIRTLDSARKMAFKDYWNSRYPKYPWDGNPWVAVYCVKVIAGKEASRWRIARDGKKN